MTDILTPLWTGDEMLYESALPMEGPDGTAEQVFCLYRPDAILSVESATRETAYEPGTDYVLENGRIVIPPSSRIALMRREEYYPSGPDACGSCFPAARGGWIACCEGDIFHRRQIVFSYRHSDRWTMPVPRDGSALLPRTRERLARGEGMRLLIFGDSIATGVNASGAVGAPPMQKPWFSLAADELHRAYGSKTELLNTSVGGTDSAWGRRTARDNAAALAPDLCVIAFGMNDGSAMTPAGTYVENVDAIMDAVLREKPDCEFLLTATTLANPEARGFAGLQEAYLAPLLALEREGVCVMDMTTFHKSLLSRKPFRDMTGNNINHPNDFLARIYASYILSALEDKA